MRGSGLALLYAVLAALVVAPVFAVAVPGLGDTLNHLARIDIMARLGTTPDLQRFYQAGWRFVPYYGMDIPVLALTRFLPIYAAGKVFLAACVLMPATSLAVLRRAVHGRVGLVPVAGFVFAYSLPLAYGFLNYVFSAGLAVMLVAGWIGAVGWGRWPRVVVFSAALIGLYLCHAMAAASYCLMVGGWEIGRAAQARFRPLGVVVADWVWAGAQAVPLAVLVGLTAGQTRLGPAPETVYGSVQSRLAAMLSPFYFPNGGTLAALSILAALAGLFLLPRSRLSVPVAVAAALVGLAALAMPRVLLNVWGSDLRLPLLCVVLVLASVSAGARLGPRAVRVLAACAVILAVAKSWAAFGVLSAVDGQVAQMRALVRDVPRGSRVLVVEMGAEAPGRVVPVHYTGHLALVASIDRDCFVPYLFTGASALNVKPAMESSGSPNGAPISLDDLRDGMARNDPARGAVPSRLGGRVYWWGWPEKFDYVVIEHFGAALPELPGILSLVGHQDIADLYRISRRAAGA